MTSALADLAPAATAVRISVVLCCYTMDRWQQIVAARDSLRTQTLPPAQILVVVDHCAALFERAQDELAGVRVLVNDGPRGLSGARNAGVAASSGDVVAFLDDDATADRDWLRRLAGEYADPNVLGVGGHVEPAWAGGRPSWFPPEFDWVVGCSHPGMPPDAAAVRNFIGANMSFRREVLAELSGFRPDLGRIGTRPVGCEETELCIRAAARFPGGVLRYQPNARVRHHVPPARGTWGYFRDRCYAEGLSKAAVSRLAGSGAALASERRYVATVLPRGLVTAAATGRPARGAALLAGLAATCAGYLAGHLHQARRGTLPVWSRIARPAAQMSPLLLATIVWLLSLRSVDLAAMTDLGLVSVLPPAYWTALALILVTVTVLNHTGRASPVVLVAYLAGLILVLHATPCILYDSLRYGWAWKHVGIVDYIVRHHGVDPQIGGPFSAYHSWPGFFALNALLVKASGLTSALSYAAWAPPVFELIALGPLRLLFAALARDRRQVWLALVVFYLGNWVGQDYFSPQAFAYLLYLVILVVCLRWLPPTGRHRGLPRWLRWLGSDLPRPDRGSPPRRGAALAVVLLLMLAVVSSHQLTPFMLLSALSLLVLGRHIGPAWLPWLLAGLTLAWIYLMAMPFLGQNLYWIVASIGHPGENTQSTFVDLSHAPPEQLVVSYAARGLTGGMGVLAAVGWLRLRRLGQPRRTPTLLVASPVLLLAVNNYGGEMLFRVFLFALPFLALLAAGAIYPLRASRRAGSLLVPVLLAVALAVPFTLAYYGKERVNHFSAQEVAASTWLYDHAPDGSLIVGATAAFPWAFTHYESYDYTFLENLPPAQRKTIAGKPVPIISALVEHRRGPAFVILDQTQADSVRYTGVLSGNAVTVIAAALRADPSFHVAYSNRDAIIFELAGPGPAAVSR